MKSPGNVVLTVARVLLGVALVWLVASKTDGWNRALHGLQSPALILAVIAISVACAFIEAWRFSMLLSAQGLPIGFAHVFRIVTAAFSFNFCLPGGVAGDLSKLFYLRTTHSGKTLELATVVFMDRLVGLMSLLLAILVLGAANRDLVTSIPVLSTLLSIAALATVAILVFAAPCLSRAPSLRRFVVGVLPFMPLSKHLQRAADALFQFGNRRGAIVAALAISLAGSATGIVLFTLLGQALFPQSRFPVPALLSLFGTFANTITITPGGLGIGEAAFDALFSRAGLAGGAAMLILWRVGMIPLCALGIGFYIGGLRAAAKDTSDAERQAAR